MGCRIRCGAASVVAWNWQGSCLLAWVLMPDHWHGLVQLGEGEVLSSRIGWIKAAARARLRQRHASLGRLWARSYHDRALRMEDDLLAAARYMVLNPRACRVGAAGWRLSVLGRRLALAARSRDASPTATMRHRSSFAAL